MKHNFPQKLFGVVFPKWLVSSPLKCVACLHLLSFISLTIFWMFKVFITNLDASTCYRISSKGLHATCLWPSTYFCVFFSLNNLILCNARNSFLAFSCATSLIWSVYCFSVGITFIYNWSGFHIPMFLFLDFTDQGVNIYRKPPIYKQHGKWSFTFYVKSGVSTELKGMQTSEKHSVLTL